MAIQYMIPKVYQSAAVLPEGEETVMNLLSWGLFLV